MIAWLKRLLNRKKEREQRTWAEYYAKCEEQRIEREERAMRHKAEWEARNEREKRIDACYLGTRKKAFYGTYEEWLSGQQSTLFSAMVGHQASQLQAQQLQAQQLQAQQMKNYYSGRGGVFGSIFG